MDDEFADFVSSPAPPPPLPDELNSGKNGTSHDSKSHSTSPLQTGCLTNHLASPDVNGASERQETQEYHDANNGDGNPHHTQHTPISALHAGDEAVSAQPQ